MKRLYFVSTLIVLALASPLLALQKNVASQYVFAHLNGTASPYADHTSGTTNVTAHCDGTYATGGTATHIANGTWRYSPSQAETNCTTAAFDFVNSGAFTVVRVFDTTSPQTGDGYAYAVSHLSGTLAAGSHVAQSGDSFPHLNGTLGTGTHTAQTGDGYGYLTSHLSGTLAAGNHVAQTGDSYGYLGSHLSGTLDATKAGYLDAAISSRSTYAGGAVASVTAGVTLADDAITAAKIAADAIGASEIAAGAITSSEAPNLDAAVSTRSTVTTAQVNAEVDTALADINLDHLAGTAAGIPAVPAGTWLDQIMDDGTASYDRTTDSLQALRDASVDAAGLVTDIWAHATPVAIKAKTDNLPASPAAVGSNMGSCASVTAPVTAGTVSDKTGYALAVAPLDAAGTRAALGMAAADLDAQFDAISVSLTPQNITDISDAVSTAVGAAVATETADELDARHNPGGSDPPWAK